MKNIFTCVLIIIVCNTYSQTNINDIPDPNIPVKNLQDIKNQEVHFMVDDIREKNDDKALDVVAPIDETGSDDSKPQSAMDFVIKDANKVKLVDYSNVRPSDVYTTNEDGTRTAKGDSYNTTTGEVYNDETANKSNYNSHSSIGGKLLKIGGIIICWFIVGFLINIFFYGGKPDYLLGKSNTAKSAHIIVNIITIIILLTTLFS